MKIIDCIYENRMLLKDAIRIGDNSISFKDLWEKSLSYSNRLKEVKANNIALYLPNSIEYFIAYFAILLAEKTVVPIGYVLGENEVRVVLRETAACLITMSYHESFNDVDVLFIDKNDEWMTPEFDYDEYKGSKVAVIFPTSGTTSRSKYVQLTNENIMQNVFGIMNIHHMTREKNTNDNELLVLPLTASFCNSTHLVCLYCAMTIALLDGRISIPKIFRLMKKHEIHYCEMTPTLLRIFAQHYSKLHDEKIVLKRVSCGGETISMEELNIVHGMLPGIDVYNGYGLTEAGPVVSTQTSSDFLVSGNSVGKLLDGFKIRFKEIENLSDYPVGTGEIELKGPCIMKGYLNEEKPSVVDGWLSTGDIGYMDKEKNLYVIGRIKNIIISGGRNVNAEEVEKVVRKCDAVEECKAYGEKSSVYGEIVVIDIVMKKDSSIDDKEIIQFCKKFLADYKIPQKINRVELIEKNSFGKIIRY